MSSETIDVPIDGLEAICMVAREQQLRILGVEVTSDQDSVVTGLLAIYCLKNPRFGQTSVLRSLLERVEIGELEITCHDREPLEVTAIAKEWLGRSPQEMSIYIQMPSLGGNAVALASRVRSDEPTAIYPTNHELVPIH